MFKKYTKRCNKNKSYNNKLVTVYSLLVLLLVIAYTDGKHDASDGYRPHYHPRLGTSGMLHYDLHCWY